MKQETIIQRSIQNFVRAHGGIVYKLHGNEFQATGLPDLFGALPVIVKLIFPDGNTHSFVRVAPFVMECKTETGEVSRIQAHRIHQFQVMGYATGFPTCLNDFTDIIETYVRTQGLEPAYTVSEAVEKGVWEIRVIIND